MRRVFDGILPLVFLGLSSSYLLIRLFSLARQSFARSSAKYEQLASTDAPSRRQAGSSPIAQAESRVLREVAEKESPDWQDPSTQDELLGDDAEPQVVEADPAAEHTGRNGLALAGRAVWGCKKDVLNVIANAAMLAFCTLRTVRAFQRGQGGRAWIAVEMASWVCVLAGLVWGTEADNVPPTGLGVHPLSCESLARHPASLLCPHTSVPPAPQRLARVHPP